MNLGKLCSRLFGVERLPAMGSGGSVEQEVPGPVTVNDSINLPSSVTKERLAAALEKKVSGEAVGFLATGHRKSLKDQFRLVRSEFAGEPLLCWKCARLIIAIRRGIDAEIHWATLRYLLETPAYRDLLLSRLNTRWLIAICDTYADYGSPAERAAALALSLLINVVKLAETERLILRDSEYDEVAIDGYLENFPHSLWDGVTSYSIGGGDMPRNLFARLKRELSELPPLDAIGDCLIERMRDSESNVLFRLSTLNPGFWE